MQTLVVVYSRRGKKGREFDQSGSLHLVAPYAENTNSTSDSSNEWGGFHSCHQQKEDIKSPDSYVVEIDRRTSRVADEIRNNRFGIKPVGPFGSVLSLYLAVDNNGQVGRLLGRHQQKEDIEDTNGLGFKRQKSVVLFLPQGAGDLQIELVRDVS